MHVDGTNPSELVAQGRKDKEWLRNFLMDLVSELEKQGKAGSYFVSNLKAIKSWLSHNGVDFKRRIKVRGADDTPTLRGKHTLSTGQLVTSLISKVTVSPGSISTAGLRLLAHCSGISRALSCGGPTCHLSPSLL